MPVFFIAMQDSIYEKVKSNIQEVRARKGDCENDRPRAVARERQSKRGWVVEGGGGGGGRERECVCVCVCVFACVCVICDGVGVCDELVCASKSDYVCMCALCVCVWMCVCMRVCVCVCVFVFVLY